MWSQCVDAVLSFNGRHVAACGEGEWRERTEKCVVSSDEVREL